MKQACTAVSALLAMLALAACATGAGDADYSQQRGIDSDISASLDHGPTSSRAGMIGSEEPIGALPWDSRSSFR